MQGGAHPVALRRVWPAAAALAATGLWGVAQMSSWVPLTYQNPIWGMAREALELNVSGSISVNRDATALALLRLVTAACVFWLALQLGRFAWRAMLIVQAVAVIGFAYALYGLVAFFAFPKTILWFDKVHYLDAVTSTFINRNSYATYAAIGLIASVGAALSAFAAGANRGGGRQAVRLMASLTGPAGGWLAVGAIIALALVLTGSRGGITAGFLGLGVAAVLSVMLRRNRRSTAAVAAVLALLMVLGIALTFGELLATRLSAQGFRADDRLAVYATVMMSIWDQPLLGFGYGTFEHVFPMYRDARIDPIVKWDKAHNTYLEVFQGLGIPVAILFIAGVGSLIWRTFRGALGRRRNVTIPIVASAASVAVLVHGLVDFSLQIQGVTLTWLALLGVGVAQSWSMELDVGS